MATYQEIVDKINGITDNGNNSAAEVRVLLKDLLDFTKNPTTTPAPSIDFFSFWSEASPAVDKSNNKLWYSFRGIKDKWVNFTFRIEIISNKPTASSFFNNVYKFPIFNKDLDLIEIMSKISTPNLPTVRFVIPFTVSNEQAIFDFPLSTSIYIQEQNIVFDFNNQMNNDLQELMIANGVATSSVIFHYPDFVIGKP
jgi:hypothetical protein